MATKSTSTGCWKSRTSVSIFPQKIFNNYLMRFFIDNNSFFDCISAKQWVISNSSTIWNELNHLTWLCVKNQLHGLKSYAQECRDIDVEDSSATRCAVAAFCLNSVHFLSYQQFFDVNSFLKFHSARRNYKYYKTYFLKMDHFHIKVWLPCGTIVMFRNGRLLKYILILKSDTANSTGDHSFQHQHFWTNIYKIVNFYYLLFGRVKRVLKFVSFSPILFLGIFQ